MTRGRDTSVELLSVNSVILEFALSNFPSSALLDAKASFLALGLSHVHVVQQLNYVAIPSSTDHGVVQSPVTVRALVVHAN